MVYTLHKLADFSPGYRGRRLVARTIKTLLFACEGGQKVGAVVDSWLIRPDIWSLILIQAFATSSEKICYLLVFPH